MKIQTVRFKNLNSLSGEWCIDFTDPHFSSSGIFAIVGATGAGKSTILDAISLALYGRTPRLKQVSKSTNEIMSRHSGECFSEVEFTSSKGRFRVHWSQHRARKKPSGDLQPPRHEFVIAKSGKVIANKLKDVAEEVIEATGMDFDQFTRSMLLAQGDFNKFLQANSDERAPILEQITGTEIYSEISKQVHKQYVDEKNKLDLQKKELENLATLSQEEVDFLRKQHLTAAEESAILQEQMKQTTAGINWHLNIEKLKSQEYELSVLSSKLQNEWEEASPSRERLKKAQQCQLLQGHYTHLIHLRNTQKEEKIILTQTSKRLSEIELETRLLQSTASEEEKQYQAVLLEEKEKRDVIKQVRQLDYELGKLRQEIQKNALNEIQIQKDIETLNNAQEDNLQKIRVSQKALDGFRNFLGANAENEELIETFSGIEEKSEQLIRMYNQLASERKRIIFLEQQIRHHDEKQKALLEKVATFSHQETKLNLETEKHLKKMDELAPDGLASIYQKIQNLKSDMNLCKENRSLLVERNRLHEKMETEQNIQRTLQEENNTLRNGFDQTKQLLVLQRENVNKQEEIVLFENKIAGFEEERARLKPNSPCPLCGSTEHPFKIDEIPLQSSAEELLAAAKRRLAELDTMSHSQEIELSKRTEHLKNITAMITEAGESLEKIKAEFSRENYPYESLEELDFGVQALVAQLNLTEKIRIEAETINRKLAKTQTELKSTSAQLTTLKTQSTEAQTERSRLQAAFEQKGIAMEELNNESQRLAAILSTPLDKGNEGLLTNPQGVEEALGRLKDKITRYKRAQTSFQKEDTQLQELNRIKEQLLHSLKLRESALAKVRNDISLLRSDHDEILMRRKTLFADASPDQVEQQLQAKIEQTAKASKTSQLLLVQKEKELTTITERKESLTRTISKRDIDLISEEKHFKTLLGEHGFPSEQHFLDAKIPPDEQESLQQSMQALEKHRVETETKLGNCKEELARVKAEEITDLVMDQLSKKLEEQNGQLSNLQQQLGALTERIKGYEEAVKKQHDKQQALLQQQKEFEHWAQLHSLIGSSDGKKFRNFAQGLTFELMVRHANQTLDKMSDRYLLKRLPDAPLELAVIDSYQAGETRSTVNLSGGETFIISLALALGLSAMASKKVQIDSLFLDEGFGTLDEESLEIALETLSTLQQRGKIIGIISHVPLLKERIDVQLRLSAGTDGRSRLSGPGVSYL